MASIDKDESRRISARVSRDEAAKAAAGRPHGGGNRCYGYERSGDVVLEEAEELRAAARRIVAGESLRAVVQDWNARGLRTTNGKPWQEFPLRRLLRSPRLAGVREHKGQTYPAAWPAILTDEEHEAVCLALAGGRARSGKRSHLLAGLLTCGGCGRPMRARQAGHPRRRVYACIADPGRGSCGKVSVGEEATDAVAVERVLSFLARASLAPAASVRSAVDQLDEAVEADEAGLVELARERFVTRTISAEEYGPVRAELVERLARNRSALAAALSQMDALTGALQPGSRADLDAWWQDADDEAKRGAILRAVERVTVAPAERRGGNRFDPDRLHVRLRLDVYREAMAELSSGERDDQATEDDLSPEELAER